MQSNNLSSYAGCITVDEVVLLMRGDTEAQQRANAKERGMGRVLRTCLSDELALVMWVRKE